MGRIASVEGAGSWGGKGSGGSTNAWGRDRARRLSRPLLPERDAPHGLRVLRAFAAWALRIVAHEPYPEVRSSRRRRLRERPRVFPAFAPRRQRRIPWFGRDVGRVDKRWWARSREVSQELSWQLRPSCWGRRAPPRRAATGPPCARRRRPRPDRGSRCARRRRWRGSISTPRFIGPGCMTMASGLASASRARVQAERAAVLARARQERARQPLALDAQHHHDVGALERRLERGRRRRRRASRPRAASACAGRRSAPSAPIVRKQVRVRARDAAVARCRRRSRPSSPSSLPLARRMVNASSSACVGCSCVPSPALTTRGPRARGDVVRARPRPAWRITRTSGCIASRFFTVSSSVSPLTALERRRR